MHHRSYLSALMLLAASCTPPVGRAGRQPAPAATTQPAALSLSPQAVLHSAPAAEAPRIFAAQTIAPGGPAAPFVNPQGSDAGSTALQCLTAAVYYEARSESEDGQRAVAQVVLNRVRHPAFPRSVCGVVYQGSERRTGCQFSFTCDGSTNRARDPAAWDRARRIAEDALNGAVFARVGFATHYHTTAILPYWAGSLTKAVTVGSHIFYRWRGEQGTAMAFRQHVSGSDLSWNAPDAAPSEQPGVERFRGADGATVTIHRGSSPDAVDVAEVEPAVRVHFGKALARSEPPMERQETFGVRVHRGSSADEATAT